MSLWAEYINELRGGKVSFIEQEHGFISWSFPEWAHNCIMINDIYVRPDARMQGVGKLLLEQVCEIGRKAGRLYVTSELHLDTCIYAESMRAQIAVGFVPVAAENGRIFMRRSL